MISPYQVVKDFESALCDYTGAKYAVTTTSCTMALLLACRYEKLHIPFNKIDVLDGDLPTYPTRITIPKRTYVGVPMSIIHAGFGVAFEDKEWEREYQLKPLPVIDSARYFTSGMFSRDILTDVATFNYNRTGQFVCVSFHWSKTLAIGQGGAILHDSDEADEWFRMMRFDGRKEGVEPRSQKDWVLGYHCYMSPRDAAEGLSRLSVLPEQNDPIPNDDYPDLSKLEIFK